MKRVILHYDMDAFFASVEIRDNNKYIQDRSNSLLKYKKFISGEFKIICSSENTITI